MIDHGFKLVHGPGTERRDWAEDFPHENGEYINRCIACDNDFWGHKRRVVCRVCAGAAESE